MPAILSALILSAALQEAQITVSYDGVPEVAQAEFQRAAEIWENCLVSDVDIRVHVSWIPRGPTGFATQRLVRNAAHLPVRDAWYPSALANALAGVRDQDSDDMNIFLSARTNWYFSSESPIAADQTDFINVAIHEIAHGLGISSSAFIPWQGEPVASLDRPNDYVNFFDYTFALHAQDGTPYLYDTFIRIADGRALTDFPNPSLELTLALANPTIHFTGAHAIAANNGYPVGVEPTNISHIPAFPRSPNPIMLADSGQGETLHQPDAILVGMLQDLGWQISEACR